MSGLFGGSGKSSSPPPPPPAPAPIDTSAAQEAADAKAKALRGQKSKTILTDQLAMKDEIKKKSLLGN